MSFDWDAFEGTMKAVIATAAGLPAASVLWSYERVQGGSRPVGGPFIVIEPGTLAPWGDSRIGSYYDYDATRPTGKEIRIYTLTQHEMILHLRCFGGTTHGNTSSVAILTRCRERLSLPTQRDALNDAGIGTWGGEPVTYVPAVSGTQFEGRAAIDLPVYLDISESEYTGYIARLTLDGTITNPDATITLDVSQPGARYGSGTYGLGVYGGP